MAGEQQILPETDPGNHQRKELSPVSFYNLLSLKQEKPIEQKATATEDKIIVLSHPDDIHSLLDNLKNQQHVLTSIPANEVRYDAPTHSSQQNMDVNRLSSRLDQMEEKLQKYSATLTAEIGVFTKDLTVLRQFLQSVLEAVQSTAAELQTEIEKRDMQIKRLTELIGEQARIQQELARAVASVAKEPETSWLEKLLGVKGGRA